MTLEEKKIRAKEIIKEIAEYLDPEEFARIIVRIDNITEEKLSTKREKTLLTPPHNID